MTPQRNPSLTGILSRPGEVFCGLLFSFYAVVILLHQKPPLMGDFADWIYSGQIIGRHLHGLADPFHSFKHYPVPNATLTALLGVLCFVFSWQMAAKLYLVLHLAVAFFAMRSLGRAAGSSQWAFPILAGSAFLGLGFWYGLDSFALGVMLLMFFLAGLLKHSDGNLPAGYGLLLLLLFLTHMVPFTFACLLLILFSHQHRRPRLLLQLVLPGIMLVWYAAGRLLGGDPDSIAAPPASSTSLGFAVEYKVNTVLKSFGFVNPTTIEPVHSSAVAVLGPWLYVLLFAINSVVCVLVLTLLARSLFRPREQPASQRFFWIAAALSLAAYLFAPQSFLGISDPGARILQTTAWPALFLVRSDSLTQLRVWRLTAVGSLLLEASAASLFILLPWRTPPSSDTHLPYAMEQLAKVPYAHCENFIHSLEANDYGQPVFPTALLVNRRDVRP